MGWAFNSNVSILGSVLWQLTWIRHKLEPLEALLTLEGLATPAAVVASRVTASPPVGGLAFLSALGMLSCPCPGRSDDREVAAEGRPVSPEVARLLLAAVSWEGDTFPGLVTSGGRASISSQLSTSGAPWDHRGRAVISSSHPSGSSPSGPQTLLNICICCSRGLGAAVTPPAEPVLWFSCR